jgi:hypothetical protein
MPFCSQDSARFQKQKTRARATGAGVARYRSLPEP